VFRSTLKMALKMALPRIENSDLASAYTRVVREVLDELMSIWRSGGTAGVATVVRTIRSAPRSPGAAMVVAPDGSVTGSVSGGCVEAAWSAPRARCCSATASAPTTRSLSA
jgi:xanthine/CO dehydrogenase XdhC/CoxF family maturation factor